MLRSGLLTVVGLLPSYGWGMSLFARCSCCVGLVDVDQLIKHPSRPDAVEDLDMVITVGYGTCPADVN